MLLSIVVVGTGATLLHDAWTGVRRISGVPPPDWRRVGRWVAWLPRGRWLHAPIDATPAVRGERSLGWAVHYAIGIAFAAAFVTLVGPGWLDAPVPMPALAFGVATVAAPFFVLQPALGAGIAASRTARPWHARFHSLVAHGVFGAGLFLAALAWRFVS